MHRFTINTAAKLINNSMFLLLWIWLNKYRITVCQYFLFWRNKQKKQSSAAFPCLLMIIFFFLISFLWNLAISGNHAARAHAIHSWAKWKPNIRAWGRALAAILQRRKRLNRKRSGNSRCHGSLFPFMKTMFVSTGTGRRTSTESGKGYTQFPGKFAYFLRAFTFY